MDIGYLCAGCNKLAVVGGGGKGHRDKVADLRRAGWREIGWSGGKPRFACSEACAVKMALPVIGSTTLYPLERTEP